MKIGQQQTQVKVLFKVRKMIIVRCRECNTEIKSSAQTQTCGCSNMLTVTEDAFSARDMGNVIVVKSALEKKESDGLTSQDLQWQEERRKRKVRKLDFEIR